MLLANLKHCTPRRCVGESDTADKSVQRKWRRWNRQAIDCTLHSVVTFLVLFILHLHFSRLLFTVSIRLVGLYLLSGHAAGARRV